VARFVWIRSFATYKTELKGVLQHEKPLEIAKTTLKTKGITGFYSGASALIIGNATKVSGSTRGAGPITSYVFRGWCQISHLRHFEDVAGR